MNITQSNSGMYAVEISTSHGKRTLSIGTRSKRHADKIVRQAKVKELETAGKITRLTRNVISQIIVGKKMTNEKTIPEWQEWMRLIGFSERTVNNYIIFVTAWMRETRTATVPPSATTEKHINWWINDEEDTTKRTTRQMRLAALQNYFKFCAAKGYALGNPAALVRVNMSILTHRQKEPRQKKVFTANEFNRLMEYIKAEVEEAERRKKADAYQRNLFWLIASPISRHAGLRLGDICTLQWDCFEKPATMVVWTDKRDARVELPIPDELADAIAQIPIEHKTFCFPTHKDLSAKAISKLSMQFSRICQRLAFKGHSFHDLRHTYATECDERGVPMPHISRSLGHRNEATTARYVHRAQQ